MTVHRTIELDDATDAQLEALAQHGELSPEELLKQLVADRLHYEEWFRAEVQKGIDDLDAGRVFTHEEVLERSARRREELLARSKQS